MINGMIAIDIETYKSKNNMDWWNKTTIEAPSNYKDLDKIEKYIQEQKAKMSGKSALYWYTAKVVSIAIVNIATREETVICETDERIILETLTKSIPPRSKLIGKNSKSFDFPFLIGRYMSLGIKIPETLKNKYDLLDVDDFFGYGQNSAKGKLDAYAFGLNIKGKTLKGSAVAKTWERLLEGDLSAKKELEEYNLQDALIVAEMARRYYGSETTEN